MNRPHYISTGNGNVEIASASPRGDKTCKYQTDGFKITHGCLVTKQR